MLHFGFSYVGLIYLLMLFIPNIIWTKNKPKDYDKYAQNENRVLQMMERIGEGLVCCIVLIFSDFNVRMHSSWSIWLLVSFLMMLLYEIYWIRYFKSEKGMLDFYRSICKIPVAGATLPVCAFLLLGIYGRNIFLILSVVVLGIGHIGIHLGHYMEVVGKNHEKQLFIIGNGFDCYGHQMHTKYSDFREYIVDKYPGYDMEFDGILESTAMPDGSEEYNMDEVVGSIVRVIDECSGINWGDLESCLGDSFIESIGYENEWAFNAIDMEKEDNEIFRSIYANEDISNSIIGAYRILKDLFVEWVFDALGNIDYHRISKIDHPSFRNSVFLNFNYTQTLEKLYSILPDKICHIHGNASDSNSEIYFGHGNDEEDSNYVQYMGIDDAFSDLKFYFRKQTREALNNNYAFFENLSEVNKIYSYGFSFSEVDMLYIEEIAKKLVPSKTIWYFNTFDWENNREYIDKVKKLGFNVRNCRRW